MRMGGRPIRGHRVDLLRDFLSDQFHVADASPNDQYPGLPLVMSLIDTALDRRQSFHSAWSLDRMAALREAIEFTIYDHLEDVLRSAPTNNHYQLFTQLYTDDDRPSVITTNYDLIADAAIMNLGQHRFADDGRFPDYRCQISDDFYNRGGECFGTLLKLHGSLNWLYRRTCGRLQLGASESTRYLKVVARNARTVP